MPYVISNKDSAGEAPEREKDDGHDVRVLQLDQAKQAR